MARNRWAKRGPRGPKDGPSKPKSGPSRLRASKNSAKLTPSAAVAWNCTVLGIDTASKSGFALRVRGVLRSSGELDTEDRATVEWVVERAVRAALDSLTTLVVILESPYGGNRKTLLGLGAARERWMSALRERKIPKRRIVFALPGRWRRPLFGPAVVRARREQIRAWELAAAQAETGLANIGPDEAAAIGISRWGARAAEVGRVLPKR